MLYKVRGTFLAWVNLNFYIYFFNWNNLCTPFSIRSNTFSWSLDFSHFGIANIYFVPSPHRRRIELEDKGKGVVLGDRILAALAV